MHVRLFTHSSNASYGQNFMCSYRQVAATKQVQQVQQVPPPPMPPIAGGKGVGGGRRVKGEECGVKVEVGGVGAGRAEKRMYMRYRRKHMPFRPKRSCHRQGLQGPRRRPRPQRAPCQERSHELRQKIHELFQERRHKIGLGDFQRVLRRRRRPRAPPRVSPLRGAHL